MTGKTSKPTAQVIHVPVQAADARSDDERLAASLRGFGPLGIFAILVIVAGSVVSPLVGAVLVLGWVGWSRTAWREIGYVRPKSWIRGLIIGIAFGCALKLLLKAVAMPLLGAEAHNPTYHYLIGNAAALPGMLLAVIVGAGFGEETVYRGYLFERLGKALGTSIGAKSVIVLLTAGLFGMAHYPEQGLAGTQQAVMAGLVWGTIFAVTGRIWTLMCMHAAFDLTAVAIIYWNLESDVAHFVFK